MRGACMSKRKSESSFIHIHKKLEKKRSRKHTEEDNIDTIKSGNIVLPMLIHAIWAGGTKKLPLVGIENLAKWIILQPDFTVILWVDEATTEETIEDLTKHYKTQIIEACQHVHEEMFEDQLIESEIQNFRVKSIREENICNKKNDLIDYMIDRIDPHYGMSSDLLRYRISLKYGGAYFDVTDVGPILELNALSQLPVNFGENEAHIIFMDHLSQNYNPDGEALAEFHLPTLLMHDELQQTTIISQSHLGNDTLICTKGNPLMKLLVEQVEKNFNPSSLFDMAKIAYFSHNQSDFTIERTGPELIKRTVMNPEYGRLIKEGPLAYSKQIGNTKISIMPARCNAYQVSQPVKNTFFWIDVDVDLKIISNIDIAYTKLVGVIQFEIDHMHIFRLDDHLRTLARVAHKLNFPLQNAFTDFFTTLEKSNLPFQSVEIAQHFSDNPLVEEFYRQHQLIDKTYLNQLEDLRDAHKYYQWITSYHLFQAPMFSMLDQVTTELINQYFKPGKIRDYFDKLDRAAIFIKKIHDYSDRYPAFSRLLQLNPQLNIIQLFADVMDTFHDAFSQANVEILKADLYRTNKLLSTFGATNQFTHIEELLHQHNGNPEELLHHLSNENSVEEINLLLRYREVDINQKDSGTRNRTALHWAAEKGHADVVKLLLEHGADASITNAQGQTPFDCAHPTVKSLLTLPSMPEFKL